MSDTPAKHEDVDNIHARISSHEKECEKRYGKIESRLSRIEATEAHNTKMIWVVFAAIILFELNTIFKIVGG